MNENGSPCPCRHRLIWTIFRHAGRQVQDGADLVGDRDAAHLDVDDVELLDALVEILEKAVVLDRLKRLRQVGRDERALALDLDEQVLADELAQRLANRHAADFQLAPELVFGGDLQSGTVLPGGDTMADDLFDLVIQRDDAVFTTPRGPARLDRAAGRWVWALQRA